MHIEKRLTQFSSHSGVESPHATRLCRQLEQGGTRVEDTLEARKRGRTE